jgi:hypothetical protein
MSSCPSTAKKKKNKERGKRRRGRKWRDGGGREREREKPGKEGERDELFMIDLTVSCKSEFMDL